jgi:DNA processing protein
MNDQALKALLLLNRLPGLHAKNIGELLSLFGTLDALVDPRTLNELSALNAAGKRLSDRIRREHNVFDAEQELRLIEKNNVDIIGFEDQRYPSLLREIADPPLALYQRGLCDLEKESLSIVGSRNASFYGLEIAEAFAKGCAEHSIRVVSGFAKGIDAAAHRGALAAGGTTVAVLGCGVDVIYPRSHERLYEEIMENGALISEFAMGTAPFGYNFPQRNRIIAGLSRGVLVVEASPRSGSLITARLALEEGREVYSIPGKINYEGAKGTNRLLREGARFVESIEDILEDYPGCQRENDVAPQQRASQREGSVQALSLDEQQVLALISSTPKSADDIGRDLTLPLNTVQMILTQLELKKVITKRTGGAFVLLS